MLNESDIQKLLRLKRHEQPPEGYFDNFLQDFHHRQRAELLRRSAWKIMLERWETFFSEHSLGRSTYAMATAVVLMFAGITSVGILNSGGPVTTDVPHHSSLGSLAKNDAVPSNKIRTASFSNVQPRYVIDTRPVSYERPFSF